MHRAKSCVEFENLGTRNGWNAAKPKVALQARLHVVNRDPVGQRFAALS